MKFETVATVGFCALALFGANGMTNGAAFAALSDAGLSPTALRHDLTRMLGAVGSGLNALGGLVVSSARADEAVPPVDPSKLVKFEGRDYRIDYQPWVSTEPVSQVSVKKISRGVVTYVNVVTTSTGVYSSEAMLNPHILYPGVKVTQLPPNTDGQTPVAMAYWNGRSTWVAVPLDGTPSFTSITPLNGGGSIIWNHSRACVALTNSFMCL